MNDTSKEIWTVSQAFLASEQIVSLILMSIWDVTDCTKHVDDGSKDGSECSGKGLVYYYYASDMGCQVYYNGDCRCNGYRIIDEAPYQHNNYTTCWVNGCDQDLTFDHHETTPLMGIISVVVLVLAIITAIIACVIVRKHDKIKKIDLCLF